MSAGSFPNHINPRFLNYLLFLSCVDDPRQRKILLENWLEFLKQHGVEVIPLTLGQSSKRNEQGILLCCASEPPGEVYDGLKKDSDVLDFVCCPWKLASLQI